MTQFILTDQNTMPATGMYHRETLSLEEFTAKYCMFRDEEHAEFEFFIEDTKTATLLETALECCVPTTTEKLEHAWLGQCVFFLTLRVKCFPVENLSDYAFTSTTFCRLL